MVGVINQEHADPSRTWSLNDPDLGHKPQGWKEAEIIREARADKREGESGKVL